MITIELLLSRTLSETALTLVVGDHEIERLTPFPQMGDSAVITLAYRPLIEEWQLQFKEQLLSEALHIIDILIDCFFRIEILDIGEVKKAAAAALFKDIEDQY